MTVLDALGDGVDVVRRRPVLIPVLFLGGLPLPFLNSLDLWMQGGEMLGRVLSILVAPFLFGGGYGIVSEALDGGDVTPSSFVGHGADNYLSILGATILLYLGGIVAGIGLAILLLVPVLNVLAALALIPIGILLVLVLQFVNVAIVVDDRDAISAYSRSYQVAMDHLGSVFGYVIVRALIIATFLAPTVVALVQEMSAAPNMETYTAGPTVTAAVALFALGSVVLLPFHVAFYDRVTERASTPPSSDESDVERAGTGSSAGTRTTTGWDT